MNIRDEFDKLVCETTDYVISETPAIIIENLNKWKWGSYGWTSPVSLIVTATWRKHFYPEEDCCKIWAKDENNNPIEGGYSIRSEDESITIPILAKYDLCNGYCSANSGMQGSRAIEKMRTLRRLNTDFDSAQRTIFDLKLFATILNQINDLDSQQALRLLQYEIVLAKQIKKKRDETNASLENTSAEGFDLMAFLSETADPELTKCVVASCAEELYADKLEIDGVTDYKTAADARAQKPGDLCLKRDENVVIAIEVKDKSQSIDWNNIDRAKKILQDHPSIENFIFALENRSATVNDTIQDIISSGRLESGELRKISFESVHDLYLLAVACSSVQRLAERTGYYLAKVPAVKPETKTAWLEKNADKN